MSHNTTKAVAILIFVAILANYGFCEEKRQIEVKMSVYPKNVAFGDTCYVLVTATNHSSEIVGVPEPNFSLGRYRSDPVRFDLYQREKTWHGTFESWSFEYLLRKSATPLRFGYFPIPVPKGETISFIAVPLHFPPLEDLYQDDFWIEKRKELMLLELLDLKEHQKRLSFDFRLEFSGPHLKEETSYRMHLTQNVTVKSRGVREMELIEHWYRDTPKEFLPTIIEEQYAFKVSSQGPKESKKTIHGYNPWYFINIGNRYPGDPNVPTTWQGWKKLEESLTPSTMRDEIRLTRILIQYSATNRAAVLKELKDWFDGMNEIQRTVMAKSLRDRAVGTYGTNLLPQFREVYKTIREYDIVPIPEDSVKHLRDLGLLE